MPYKDPERERERKRAVQARKRASDPEHVRRLRRESMRRNPHKRRMWEGNRRARKLTQFIESVRPEVVYKMHGGMCGVCKQFIDGDFHVDHVIPLSKGGMHGYINVQPAHPLCNMRKADHV